MKKIETDSGFVLYLHEEVFERKWSHLVVSLPEIGLVGILALRHLAKQFNMKPVGFALSDDAALLFKYENGEHVPNIRILMNEGILSTIFEYPITPTNVLRVGKFIVDIIKNISPDTTIMLGSTPSLTREKKDLENINVFGAPSNHKLKELLKENNIQIVQNGTLSGPFAYVLNHSVINEWDSFVLLSETYPAPIGIDPESAAKLLLVLGSILGRPIDIKELKERAEEIKLEMRKLEQLAAPQPPKEIGQLYT